MRIWDQSGTNSQESEGFNLQMCRLIGDVGLVQSDVTVVLLVDVLEHNVKQKLVTMELLPFSGFQTLPATKAGVGNYFSPWATLCPYLCHAGHI